MSSLAGRLLLGTTLVVALVTGLAGAALYRLVEERLVGEVDAALVARARLLTSAVELDDGEVELEFEAMDLWEFGAPERGWFLEVRQGSEVLYRSPSLGGATLAALEAPAPAWAELPGGARARALVRRFQPRPEGRPRRLPTLTCALARDAREVDRTLGALRALLLGVGAGSLLATGLALTLVVRRSLAPLGAVCDRIAAIGAADLSARLDAARVPTELLPVVQRVNDLLARLDGAFTRERAFSNDVAHELRTPLAGLRALLEVTAARPRDEAEYAAALREAGRLVDQLAAMVDRLLQLARLEGGATVVAPERVDLEDLLLEAFDPYVPVASARRLRVDWALGDGVALETDPRLLGMVLRNLLENAVTYADEDGRVQVVARRAGDDIVVEVSNTGSALTQAQADQATQRFWRGTAARSEAGAHCGLGLSLVDRAARALGGRVQLRSEAGGEFVARVELPSGAPRP